jgi:hypothetical protein
MKEKKSERIAKTISFTKEKYEELKNEAKEMDVPITTLIKMKISGK